MSNHPLGHVRLLAEKQVGILPSDLEGAQRLVASWRHLRDIPVPPSESDAPRMVWWRANFHDDPLSHVVAAGVVGTVAFCRGGHPGVQQELWDNAAAYAAQLPADLAADEAAVKIADAVACELAVANTAAERAVVVARGQRVMRLVMEGDTGEVTSVDAVV